MSGQRVQPLADLKQKLVLELVIAPVPPELATVPQLKQQDALAIASGQHFSFLYVVTVRLGLTCARLTTRSLLEIFTFLGLVEKSK